MDAADDDYVMVNKPPDTEDGPTSGAAPDDAEGAGEADGDGEGEHAGAGEGEGASASGTPQKKKRRTELELALPLPASASSVSRSGRQRKAPAVFTPTAPPEKKTEVEVGGGTPLGQIPNVAQRLEKTKTSAPELRRLYSLCFPLLRGLPTKLRIKPLLRSFSGLTRDEQRQSARGKMRRMLKEEKMPVIGRLLLMMDLDYEEGKEKETVDKVMDWLERPSATGREFQVIRSQFMDKRAGSGKKGRSSSGGAGSKKKKKKTPSKKRSSDGSSGSGSESDSGSGSGSGSGSDGSSPSPRKSPKASSSSSKKKGGKSSDKIKSKMRTTNSFVVFSSAKRDEVREAFPELTVQQLTRKLASLWHELPPSDREVYELAAKRLREDAARQEKKQRKKSSKKKPSSSKKPSKPKPKKPSTPTKKRKKPEKDAAGSGSSSDSGSSSSSSGEASGSDSGTEDEDEAMAQQQQQHVDSSAVTSGAATPSSSSSSPSSGMKIDAVDANGREEKADVGAAVKSEEHNGTIAHSSEAAESEVKEGS